MSGVYIPGMKMPKDRAVYIAIDTGDVFIKPLGSLHWVHLDGKAVEIPDHGRTIDADAFKKRMMQGAIDAREDALTDEIWRRVLDAAKSLCLDVDEQPTIIPEDKEEKT